MTAQDDAKDLFCMQKNVQGVTAKQYLDGSGLISTMDDDGHPQHIVCSWLRVSWEGFEPDPSLFRKEKTMAQQAFERLMAPSAEKDQPQKCRDS